MVFSAAVCDQFVGPVFILSEKLKKVVVIKKNTSMPKKKNADPGVQFDRLRGEIAAIKSQLETLRSFIAEISKNASFDQTDVEKSVEAYKTLAMSLQAKEQDLQYREDLYNKHIRRLEGIIDSRQGFLEQETQNALFAKFPDLLQYYVSKQSSLSESLTELKTKLET